MRAGHLARHPFPHRCRRYGHAAQHAHRRQFAPFHHAADRPWRHAAELAGRLRQAPQQRAGIFGLGRIAARRLRRVFNAFAHHCLPVVVELRRGDASELSPRRRFTGSPDYKSGAVEEGAARYGPACLERVLDGGLIHLHRYDLAFEVVRAAAASSAMSTEAGFLCTASTNQGDSILLIPDASMLCLM